MPFVTDHLYHLAVRVDPPEGMTDPEAMRGLYCFDFDLNNGQVEQHALEKARSYHADLLAKEGVVSGSKIIATLYREFAVLEVFPEVVKE